MLYISRWRDDAKLRNELELNGPMQFNALLFEVDTETKLAKSVVHIYLEV